jgi:hypothetical protein
MVDHDQVVLVGDLLQRLVAERRERTVLPDELDLGVELLPRVGASP